MASSGWFWKAGRPSGKNPGPIGETTACIGEKPSGMPSRSVSGAAGFGQPKSSNFICPTSVSTPPKAARMAAWLVYGSSSSSLKGMELHPMASDTVAIAPIVRIFVRLLIILAYLFRPFHRVCSALSGTGQSPTMLAMLAIAMRSGRSLHRRRFTGTPRPPLLAAPWASSSPTATDASTGSSYPDGSDLARQCRLVFSAMLNLEASSGLALSKTPSATRSRTSR